MYYTSDEVVHSNKSISVLFWILDLPLNERTYRGQPTA